MHLSLRRTRTVSHNNLIHHGKIQKAAEAYGSKFPYVYFSIQNCLHSIVTKTTPMPGKLVLQKVLL